MENHILADLTGIFRNVLEEPELCLQPSTTAAEVENWDSVNHLILIHAIEEYYRIRFDLDEMISFRNVGDICSSISKRILK